MLIDSHCHPDSDDFDADREQVLARAREAGVTELVAIGGGAEPGTLDVGLRLAEGRPGVWCTVGIHPHEAQRASAASYEEMRRLAAHPKVIAVGEIGLDYYYDHSPREAQRETFRRQIELAMELELPISIHCRDAWEDCMAELRHAGPRLRGVFHCFTGTPAQAEAAVGIGFYLSFSGMLTFPKAEAIRAAAQAAPAERILVETDSPYLAPVPYRGKRNEPAWVVAVAAKMGELRGWEAQEVAERTSANFRALFRRTVA